MTGLLFGAGSITEAQLVAFSAVGAVLLFLLSVNVAVCRLYHRAKTEDARQARRTQKKKMSDVWVYHVHRSTGAAATAHRESASQQILRKLRASHENLRATLAAAEEQGTTLGQEESQVLEELEITADLFLHDTSNASSRRSSLSDRRSDCASLHASISHDLGAASALRDLDAASGRHDLDDAASALCDLDAASALRDLDAVSALQELDKTSLSSVRMADFENDPAEMLGVRAGRKRGGRRSKRGSREDSGEPALPVAEFHNEAFDFAESSTAVERVQDVEL